VKYVDYYQILGVSRDAEKSDIKKAYRKLARKYHPDVNQAANAEDKFKEINEAYEVLKDADKRQAYDRFGADWKHGQQFDGGGFQGANYSGGGFSGGDFSDFFESIFGGAQQQPGGNPPNPQNSSAPTGGQMQSGNPCGDGVCDAFEKANPNACPQDCGGSSSGANGHQPQPSQQPGQMQPPQQSNQQIGSATQSEEEQASWYVRRYAYGFAHGVTLFTPDILTAPSGSALLRKTKSGVQVRLIFYVQKLLSEKIGKFTSAKELADGQYKFINDNKIVYILWKTSAPLFSQIKGNLKITDLYGNEKTVNASQLQLSKTPVFAEPL